MATDPILVVGRLGRAFGVRGWLRVQSFTDPIDNIKHYLPWLYQARGDQGWSQLIVEELDQKGVQLIAKIAGCQNQSDSLHLRNALVGVPRSRLPNLDASQFYLSDLIGCEVIGNNEENLGVVVEVTEAKASPLLKLQSGINRELRLVPLVQPQIIKEIDLAQKLIKANWQADWD